MRYLAIFLLLLVDLLIACFIQWAFGWAGEPPGLLEIFFTNPITLTLSIVSLLIMIIPWIRNWLKQKKLG